MLPDYYDNNRSPGIIRPSSYEKGPRRPRNGEVVAVSVSQETLKNLHSLGFVTIILTITFVLYWRTVIRILVAILVAIVVTLLGAGAVAVWASAHS
jgi:hypothetical protein